MGCYGSPINTPNIDELAKEGLLFNNMHTTALCSPTRSCILQEEIIIQMQCRVSQKVQPVIPEEMEIFRLKMDFYLKYFTRNGYNTYAIRQMASNTCRTDFCRRSL